jgi:broad specificity phosphatase PhoE
MSRADRQAALKETHGVLYSEVSRLILTADPVHLIAIGAPDDEYDPEISTILPRLREAKSQNDVHRIVHEEFVHWFGADIAGPSETYAAVSQEIWNVWQQSGGGPSKGPPPARGHGRVRAKHAPRRSRRGG